MNSLIPHVPLDLQPLHLLFCGKTVFLHHKQIQTKDAQQGKLTVRTANATEINVMALFAMVNHTFNSKSVNLPVFFHQTNRTE